MQAENELYTRYAAGIYTLCRRYTRDDDDAKDMMQDALIKALERIGTFRYTREGSLYSWIRRIAVNTALNHISRYKSRFAAFDLLRHDKEEVTEYDDLNEIPQEKLLEFISALPEVQRAVFNMFCLDGYSHREIAKLMGISEKGSAGLLAKARHRLRNRINDYFKNSL